MDENEVIDNDLELKTSDKQSEDILAKIEDIINNSEYLYDIVEAIENIRTDNAEDALIKRKKLAEDIIKSNNKHLDQVYWIETIEEKRWWFRISKSK